MMRVDVFADGGFKLCDAAEDSAASRLFVSSANQRSTRLSQDPYVGVKWT